MSGDVKLVVVSDTHGKHDGITLPEGDVLVHCGDFSNHGTKEEIVRFLDWFSTRPHPHKVFIAGNHDWGFQREPEASRALVPANVLYLEDQAAVIAGVRFYGSPWTPEFFHWAFMLERGAELRARWDAIPDDTQVLMTHGPPYGHGDVAPAYHKKGQFPRAVGCHELLLATRRVKPTHHLFGHIHSGHGVTMSDEAPGTLFGNAATCDEDYNPTNPPLVLEVAPR